MDNLFENFTTGPSPTQFMDGPNPRTSQPHTLSRCSLLKVGGYGGVVPAGVEVQLESLYRKRQTRNHTFTNASPDTVPNVAHHCKSNKKAVLSQENRF